MKISDNVLKGKSEMNEYENQYKKQSEAEAEVEAEVKAEVEILKMKFSTLTLT
jgi:hypothetical protein